MDKLADIFYLHRYMFSNLLLWFIIVLKFLLTMHYFACGWLWMTEKKKLDGVAYVEWSEDTMMAKYVDSVYLVTTTITTVGYGDFKAHNTNEPDWAIEMVYLYVVTLAGITLFSAVTNQIFTYRKLLTAG